MGLKQGLQRLWFFLSIVYLIVVILFVNFVYWPKNIAEIRHVPALYDRLPLEFKNKILIPKDYIEVMVYGNRTFQKVEEWDFDDVVKIEVKMPNEHIIVFINSCTENERKIIVEKYVSFLEQALKVKRIEVIKIAFLCWFVPVMLSYILVYVIGWIYRGFKVSIAG